MVKLEAMRLCSRPIGSAEAQNNLCAWRFGFRAFPLGEVKFHAEISTGAPAEITFESSAAIANKRKSRASVTGDRPIPSTVWIHSLSGKGPRAPDWPVGYANHIKGKIVKGISQAPKDFPGTASLSIILWRQWIVGVFNPPNRAELFGNSERPDFCREVTDYLYPAARKSFDIPLPYGRFSSARISRKKPSRQAPNQEDPDPLHWLALARLCGGRRTARVFKAQLVAQKIMAGSAINHRFASPPLAAQFADCQFSPGCNGLGQFLAQIEISADALAARAYETKDRFRMLDIYFVFHFPVLGDPFGVEIRHIDGQ